MNISRMSSMNNNMSALAIMNPNASQSIWRERQHDLMSSLFDQLGGYGSNNTATPDPIQAFLGGSRNAAADIRSAVSSVSNALQNVPLHTTQADYGSADVDDVENTEESTPNRNTDLINAMRSVVNGFNDLMNAAHEVNDRGAERLFTQLVGLGSTYLGGLARIGITFNEHGFMDINQDTMNNAEASGELARFAQDGLGTNHGFIARLDRIASSVTTDPTSFLSASARREVQGLTNVNSARANNFNARLSALHNTGMLFDSMF